MEIFFKHEVVADFFGNQPARMSGIPVNRFGKFNGRSGRIVDGDH
jgi:hypothetical protein